MPNDDEEKPDDLDAAVDLDVAKDAVDAAEAAESDAPDAGAVAVGIDVAEAAAQQAEPGIQPSEVGLALMAEVEHPAVVNAPAPMPSPVIPSHIVGKGFRDGRGTWRVVLPSGRVATLSNDYHGVTEHGDGTISVGALVEIGPFVGKLTCGVWRVDHPEA